MGPIVSLDHAAALTSDEREELQALSRAVYPPEEFADWPGLQWEWSPAEWSIRVRDEAGNLASHVGIVRRDAKHNGRPVCIAGIGSVKTHPSARRRGFAAAGLRRAAEFFRELPDVAFGLLGCEPNLMGYYSRFGWCEFGGKVMVARRGEVVEFTFGRVMTADVREAGPTDGEIDLCGPPW